MLLPVFRRKLRLYDESIGTYDQIWNEHPDNLIQNKIPLGAAALIEKSLLYLTQKDTANALRTVYLFYNQMQKSRWKMGNSLFTNFLDKIYEIVALSKNSHNQEIINAIARINAVKDSISLSAEHTEYLHTFIRNSEIISGNIKPDPENKNGRKKILLNGKSYLCSLSSESDFGRWGLIIDQEYILNNVVNHLMIKNADESDFNWEVKDADGDQLLKSENIPEDAAPVNIVFPSDLTSWTLALYPENSGLFDTFFRSGQGIFLYIFIAIVIILAFGLLFTLQTVNNELRLSKMKSYFISTVSHEFKSPLTSIRQMAEMLVHGRVPTLERQQKYYTTILQQSERLSHLIDNILDFSRMEEGQKLFRFVKTDITPVVKDIVESFQNHTASQGFDISLSIPEPVPAIVFDPEAMEQVVHNLLDNACKYSGDSRKIEVGLLQKGNSIIISVRDYGMGIRKEDQDKIFSRFYRAGDELTQTVKGSGIGLTIVKQIVEAHNGEINLESSPGEGSTFTVILSMKDIDIPPSQPSPKLIHLFPLGGKRKGVKIKEYEKDPDHRR